MRKINIILIAILLACPFVGMSQHGFITSAIGSTFDKIDLTDATTTNVGTGYYTGSDFGPNGVLYALGQSDDNLYTVDTVTGTTTLIGTMTPPVNHIWVGLAYDESTSTMYAMSSYGIAAGESSLHTVDLTNATYTLVGTQTTVTAFGCIAINDDDGQMYGMSLSAVASIYEIDKTDGSVTLVGPTGLGAAGMGHGMDYCQANSTMYLTTYDSFTFNNTLNTVDLSTGAITSIGFLSGWTPTIAIPGVLSADFSSDVSEVCIGGTVNFTNQSTGASSYSWTFEGGTPSTSTDENPSVVYNTPGIYDVTLVATAGSESETLTITDMITVNDIPAQPDTPTGETVTCQSNGYVYTTNEVTYADTYTWEVLPADAGTISGTTYEGDFFAASDWTGDYTIKVKASNSCGESIFSAELSCTLNASPSEFNLSSGGDACEGGEGVEITLDGSETGVDYYLHHEGDTVAGPIAGTGSELSFGLFSDGGYYSATASNGSCSAFMVGDAQITETLLPEVAGTPTGAETICSETTSEYTIEEVSGATSYVWTIIPEEAGTITGDSLVGTVTWDATYEGVAEIAARGENDCGAGPSGPSLEVMVYAEPMPEIAGDELVCQLDYGTYTVAYSEYSEYNWTVSGGTITEGEGTNEITVYWTADQGSVNSVDVTETKTDACEGIAETFDVTIDQCVGIQDITVDKINIYPNPAKNKINIDFNDNIVKFVEFSLINTQGKVVFYNDLVVTDGSLSKTIDLDGVPEGLYLITVKSNERLLYAKKVMVIN